MKRMLTLMCVLLVAACSDDKAANPLQGAEQNAPQPVAAQERQLAAQLAEQKNALDEESRKAAEREAKQKIAGPLLDILNRWATLRMELSRPTAPAQDMIARMETLKAEAEGAPVDSCSAPGKSQLLESMAMIIAMARPVPAGKAPAEQISQENVDKAYALQRQAESVFQQCAG